MGRRECYFCDVCGTETDQDSHLDVYQGMQICAAGGPSEPMYDRNWICVDCAWSIIRVIFAPKSGFIHLDEEHWKSIVHKMEIKERAK